MVKTKLNYRCQQCNASFKKWQGQCHDCGGWNTIVEEMAVDPAKNQRRSASYADAQSDVVALSEVELEKIFRTPTGLSEFDHVLGGGVVPGSVVLIGGDPGIGKSTLLLQVLCQLQSGSLYVTGEESLSQVAMRAARLQLKTDQVQLLAETHVEQIIAKAEKLKPRVMVIDSIQTIFTDTISSAPGGVSQLRESTATLTRYAKSRQISIFIVGHVTKEGTLAGPRVLEHMVDTVLYFEGQQDSRYRVIRAIKNRFGAVNELGVFAMTEQGLKQISNPSAIFLTRSDESVAGSVVMASWEGSRALLVEVQALLDESHASNPRRVTVGLDHQRLAMLLAVLHRHGGVATYDQDVFLNVVGGLKVMETAADLAEVVAIVSSLKNKPVPQDWIVFGELGLSGEIRPVPFGQARLQEAAKHGFKRAIIPQANQPKQALPGLTVTAVKHIEQVLDLL